MNPETSGGIEVDVSITDEPTELWWREAGDPVLLSLIEDGLSQNNDLSAAASRVRQARAIFRETQTQKRPPLDANLQADVQQQAPAQFGFPRIPTDVDTPVSLGLSTAWELDQFGRIDQLTKGALAAAQAAEAERVRLSAEDLLATSMAERS